MIDWKSQDTTILLNDKMPIECKQILAQAFKEKERFPSHVWLAASGTSGDLKWVLLSKSALLTSAEAVNRHLQSDENDIWLNPLPEFHVGGLGISARGFLSKARVVNCLFSSDRWSAKEFVLQAENSKASLTSLVPAQVFDLVTAQLKSPLSFRSVIVGGGAISQHLYKEGVKLGWRLLPSYGLTECGSQVATASIDSIDLLNLTYPLLHPLSHVRLEEDGSGNLKIFSPSLLTSYIICQKERYTFIDPKINEGFVTEDKVIFEKGQIKSINRGSNFIKIGGESVDLQRLENIIEEEKIGLNILFDIALIALPDKRLSYTIHLAVTKKSLEIIKSLVERFSSRVFPFERIRGIHCVDFIPRSPLRKILKDRLQEKIDFFRNSL